MATLTTQLNINIKAIEQSSADTGTRKLEHIFSLTDLLINSEADTVYSLSGTLLGNLPIDISSVGSVLEVDALNYSMIIAIRNKSETTGKYIDVSTDMVWAGLATDVRRIHPGGCIIFTSVLNPVGSSILTLESGLNSIPYELLVVGKTVV